MVAHWFVIPVLVALVVVHLNEAAHDESEATADVSYEKNVGDVIAPEEVFTEEAVPEENICVTETKAHPATGPTPQCCNSTSYIQARKLDDFLTSGTECTETQKNERADLPTTIVNDGVPENAALLVIDMQVDFTTGSFKLPCESIREGKLSKDIGKAMKEFAAAGGLVVLSKDYHGPGHCSFEKRTNGDEGHCENTLTDSDIEENINAARYKNIFPDHTVQGTPGAQFDPAIMESLNEIMKNETFVTKPVVVYKGFAPLFDSFSAFPHITDITDMTDQKRKGSAGREDKVTGGFATSRYHTLDDSVKHCGDGDDDHDMCRVTSSDQLEIDAHLDNPDKSDLVPMNKIMKDFGIKHIYVTGLVFDFCVKETAMYALDNKELNELKSATVITNLAGPAMEGWDGLVGPLATLDYVNEVARDLKTRGVCLVEQPQQ